MLSTVERATIVATTPPSSPRLVLSRVRADHAVLDGGWWPRSWDPVAELPGLVVALAARYGPVRQLMLNSVTWDRRFRRLAVGEGVVRVGWFASLDPAVVIATTYAGDQVDLLVVPPQTTAATAETAMREAADPASVRRAPAILAAVTATPVAGPADGQPVWEDEGGHVGRGSAASGG